VVSTGVKGISRSIIVAGSWRADKPGLKEIELGAPVHLAFDELKLGDLGFHLTIGPELRDRRVDCDLVVGNAGRASLERRTRSSPRQLWAA
jgi:hypothetical protein